jgi:peptide/nickel transport system substrate-binding protein
MRTRTRGSLAVASLAVLAMTVAACGGSGKGGGGSGGAVSGTNGLQGVNPGSGAPQKGGTLNMLGVGDVDYMDYNASYYTIGYQSQRMWMRDLYAYPAVAGKVFTPEPDLATALPAFSDGGKTLTITIR